MSRKILPRGRVPLHTLRADIDYGFREPRPPRAGSVSRCDLQGDILPYKVSIEDKSPRAPWPSRDLRPGGPRRLITAGGGRRRSDQGIPGTRPTRSSPKSWSKKRSLRPTAPRRRGAHRARRERHPPRPRRGDRGRRVPVADLVATRRARPLERQLAEDEEIERRTPEHHETPHFRRGRLTC